MVSKRKKLIIFSIFLLFSQYIYSADWMSVVADAGGAVAKIVLTDSKGYRLGQGSGFVVEIEAGQLRVVTNAHVVEEAERDPSVSIEAYFEYGLSAAELPGEAFALEIDVIDADQDLCLLNIEGYGGAALRLADEDFPSLMEELIVIGYPLGGNFKITPGFVQAFQDIDKMGRMIDLSAGIAPGNSGGPVLNGNAEVVGIATAMIKGYNFNLAVPASNLAMLTDRETSSYSIRIDGEPEDAWLFVDGKYRGKTPISLDFLNRSHSIRIEKKGYVPFETTIGGWDDGPSTFEYELESKEDQNPKIEIVTTPENASVFINNVSVGKAPLIIRRPEGRILRIRVEADGYKDKLEFYTVTGDAEQQLVLELEKGFFLW